MTLDIGTRLGDYEVTGSLGAGGMGEVYRARDTRLGRDVALKVLPADFAGDPERRARFEREAKFLAGLNHPHIATLYGYEEHDGNAFLAMELVEGEDLAARMKRGPIPVEECLSLFSQIAEGLEAAHERGIIHRDLKPANLIVSKDGRVKILDFGLAKALLPPDLGQTNISESPTITAAPTQHGQILGTAAYMSPEQARGEDIDKRTDVWSFGVVLYEALTGKRPFAGKNASDVMASILKDEPDWSELPAETPRSLRRLLSRTLEKAPSQRLRDIGDAGLEIQHASVGETHEAPAASTDRPRWIWAAAALGGFALLATGAALRPLWESSPPDAPRVLHSRWTLEPDLRLSGGFWQEDSPYSRHRPTRTAIVASPDGKTVVFAASDGIESRLYRRDLDQARATRIPGTEGAGSPFFSPDGEWIGFARQADDNDREPDYSLWTMPMAGGEAQRLMVQESQHPAPYGVTWGNGLIVYGGFTDLYSVPSTGGVPEILARPDPTLGQSSLRLPHFLPDGETLLYTVRRGTDWNPAEIWSRRISGGEPIRLIEGGSDPRYSPTGHLFFAREGTLMAAPFDPERVALEGGAVPVTSDVLHAVYATSTGRDTGAAQFALGPEGLLFVASGGVVPATSAPLLRVASDGTEEKIGFDGGAPRLSPGEAQLAYVREGGFWVLDLERDFEEPLPLEGLQFGWFEWSPDGTRIVFASDHEGAWKLYTRAADGSDEPSILLDMGKNLIPASWSQSQWLTFLVEEKDIWIAKVENLRATEPRPYFVSEHRERFPELSPDERWMAYSSNKTGRFEIYVRSFPEPGAEVRVSLDGGMAPLWSDDGRSLYYRQGENRERMMAATLIDAETGKFGDSRLVFEKRTANMNPVAGYDVDQDGNFYMKQFITPQPEPVTAIEIVHDWRTLVDFDR